MSEPAITHETPTDRILENIKNCAEGIAPRLGIGESSTAAEIVEAVNAEIVRQQTEGHQEGTAPTDPMATEPLCLGSLWGQQMVAHFGWEWVMLTFHEKGGSTLGLVSPDCAWMICPFEFVFGCLVNDVTPTVALSFNLLEDGTRIPMLRAGSYENLMAGVNHIVPPN